MTGVPVRQHAIALVLLLTFVVPCRARGAATDDAQGRPDIAPPLPVWPSDYETTTDRRPVFRLNGRFQATRYRVELARDAAFTDPRVFDNVGLIDRRQIAPSVLMAFGGEPLEDGQYYWRAFAGDDEGRWTVPANYRTFFVSDRDRDAIEPPAEVVHPRLLLSARELEAFRARLARSVRLAPGWEYLRNAARSMLYAVPPDEAYARAAPGQHANYSVIAHWYHRHLANIAFVAFVENDEKLTAKGIEVLMAACAYERWLGPLFDDRRHFDPPWNSALETAMMTTAVATGYDLLYPHLSDEQREVVREALAEKGIRPLVDDWADPVTAAALPRHQLPTGNWVMVCSTSAGVGALALLGEHPDAPRWVRLVRNRVRAWLHDRGGDYCVDNPYANNRPDPIPVVGPSEPNFGAHGGYKESIGYMNYAMRYICCFADGLHRFTGEDLLAHAPDHLLDHAAWSILAWREGGEVRQSLVPFGDSVTTAAFPLLYSALTKYRRDPLAAWLAERVVPIPQDIRPLCWLDESVPGDEPDTSVPMAVFQDVGHVVMRSGWGLDTPAAAIKFHQNRGHLDIGSFYLFGGGLPTLIDSGSSPYGSDTYRQYSSQSIAQNLVLVDGKSQKRADGELLAAVGTSRLTAASGQLKAAYPDALRSWTRDLVMLPGGVAVILDRLVSDEPHRFDLVLHPYPPFRMPYPEASPGEFLVGDEEAPARVRVLSEARFTVSRPAGFYLTTPCEYLRFDTPEPSKERTYLTLCEWPSRRLGAQPLDVSALRPGRWQVRTVGQDRRLMVQRGADADANDSTDARLVAVWDQGEKSRERHALVLAGRRLGIDNRELMRATSPVYAAIEFGRPTWARFWAAEPTRISLSAEVGADYVFIDGRPAEVRRNAGLVSFDVPTGASSVVVSELPRYIPRPRSLVRDDLLAVSASSDAPAFRPGVLAPSSSCVPEGLLAIDGDANTGWTSLPGEALPQWMEVVLPAQTAVETVRLETGAPCKGRIELWDRAKGEFASAVPFETVAGGLSAVVRVPPSPTDRIRVTVEETTPAGSAVTINTLEWK